MLDRFTVMNKKSVVSFFDKLDYSFTSLLN